MTKLQAQIRKTLGRKNKQIRKEEFIPAVVYGHNFDSQNIQILYPQFEKIFKETGESSLIDLEILDIEKKESVKKIKVLIHDIQRHPLTNQFQHIDFYKIKAGEKITLEIEFKFVGEAPVVKEQGGNLVHSLDKVEVKCFPENLVHEIEVDISRLKDFDNPIRIKDLNIPDGLEIIHDLEDVVIQAERPNVEEVEEKTEEKLETKEINKENKAEETKKEEK